MDKNLILKIAVLISILIFLIVFILVPKTHCELCFEEDFEEFISDYFDICLIENENIYQIFKEQKFNLSSNRS